MMQDLLALDNLDELYMVSPARAADLAAPCPWFWRDLGLLSLTHIKHISGTIPVSFVDYFAKSLLSLTDDILEYHSELSTWPKLELYEGLVKFPNTDPDITLPLALHTLTLTVPPGAPRGNFIIHHEPADQNCSLTTFTFSATFGSSVESLPPCVKKVVMVEHVAWQDTPVAVPKSIESIVALGDVGTLPYKTFSTLDKLSNLELKLNSTVIDALEAKSTFHPSGPLQTVYLELTSSTDKLAKILCDVMLLDEDLESLEIRTSEIWSEPLPSCLYNATSLKHLVWPFTGVSTDSLISLTANLTSLSIEVPIDFDVKIDDFISRFAHLESLSLASSSASTSNKSIQFDSFSKLASLESFELSCKESNFTATFSESQKSFFPSLTSFTVRGCKNAKGALPTSGYEKLVNITIVTSGFTSWALVSAQAPALRFIVITGCDDFKTMPDDATFAAMSSLRLVNISSLVNGPLPVSLFAASSSVESISLKVSSGTLPARIDNAKLRTLHLELPHGSRLPELCQGSALFNVTVTNSGLIGSIPESWKIQWFAILDLSGNELSGVLASPPSFSWPSGTIFQRDLPFEVIDGGLSQNIKLGENSFSGPVFNASAYPIASIDFYGTSIDVCAKKESFKTAWDGGAQTCFLSNVSCACISDFAFCVQDYNTSCPNSEPISMPPHVPAKMEDCFNSGSTRPPGPAPSSPITPIAAPVDVIPVIAPITVVPVAVPVHQSPAKPCHLPGPQPASIFECIAGVWTTRGDVSVSEPIKLFGSDTIHVNGSLTFTSPSSSSASFSSVRGVNSANSEALANANANGFPLFVFSEGFGQLVVSGCVYGNGYPEVEVVLNNHLVGLLYNSSIPTHPTLVTSPRRDRECPKGVDMRYAKVKVTMADGVKPTSCKRIGGSVSAIATRQTLTVLLQPDHSNCNTKVLIPLFVAIAIGLVIIGLIVFCWWRQKKKASSANSSGYYQVDTQEEDY